MAARKRSTRSGTAATSRPTEVDEAPETSETAGQSVPAKAAESRRHRPVWMVPTSDGGRVPEHEVRR